MFRPLLSKFALPVFIGLSALSSAAFAQAYDQNYNQTNPSQAYRPMNQTNTSSTQYQTNPSSSQSNQNQYNAPNQNPAYAPNQTSQTNQSSYNQNGRKEIAAISRDDDRPLYYQQNNRADWDYRENWHRDRNAYLSGVNQSQFDDRLAPRYGYGPYNYPNNYYNNYSRNLEAGVAARTPYAATNTYYPTNSYYNQYYGANSTGYPASYATQYGYQTGYPGSYGTTTYYPQYGTTNYSVYPQYGSVGYSMNYPQATYNTSRINGYYGDSYYRDYRNDYYHNVPGTGADASTSLRSYYNTNRPATTYPYYNVQPSSSSYHSYEFPGKTDMPYTPTQP